MNDDQEVTISLSQLAAIIARIERIESIVGQIYDRENCSDLIAEVANEHFHSGAVNRRYAGADERFNYFRDLIRSMQNGPNGQ